VVIESKVLFSENILLFYSRRYSSLDAHSEKASALEYSQKINKNLRGSVDPLDFRGLPRLESLDYRGFELLRRDSGHVTINDLAVMTHQELFEIPLDAL